MAESRIMDYEGWRRVVSEREGYQPLIILVLDRHTVRATRRPREIVLIARIGEICRVLDAYSVCRKLFRIKRKRVHRMADSHVERKSCQHGVELNGKTAAITELVGVCGSRGAERACYAPVASAWNRFLCPTLGTKQRKRKHKEREIPLKHNRTSCGVAVNKSRWGKPGVQETEGSAK